MPPLRVVYLIGELGLGGSERQLVHLLCASDQQVIAPAVVVFNRTRYQPLDNELLAAGIPVYTIPEDCQGIVARFRYLYRLFRKLRPQVVHSWTTHDNPYAGLVGWLAGVPVRWGSLRGSLRLGGFAHLPWPYRWLALHSVQRLTVNTILLKDELVHAGVSSRRVDILPNCVPLPVSSTHANDLQFKDFNFQFPTSSVSGSLFSALFIGLVGNLRRVKNHAMFIEAMAQVLPAYPAAGAVLVGQPLSDESEYPARLQAQIDDLGLQNRVHLAGFHPDIPAIMQHLTILCLTSHSEGSPNVILEAMAAGIPVVATGVGGVPEVVQEGITGFLVASGDVEGMAARVRQLLDDPTLRSRLGQAGRQVVIENHDCQQLAAILARMYQSASTPH